jgi:hypothetical protein
MNVTSSVAKQIKVAQFVRKCGYDAESFVSEEVIGVNITAEYLPRKFLWFRWSTKSDYTPAILFINAPRKGADASKKNWVLHVHGESLMPRMMELATAITKEFMCNGMHVRLETEDLQYHKYP